MAYSRCGLNNALYKSAKTSFVRHANDQLMNYSIHLALLAVVRTLASGLKTEFTVMSISLICPHFCIDLHSASSDIEGRLLTDEGFYLHITEDPIYETNLAPV